MIIYKITNIINNKIYIGQTILSIKRRWIKHCQKNQCVNLYRAICKYGRDSFKIEQIDSASNQEELNVKEEYWIRFYDSMNPKKGYNLKSGGSRGKASDETKKKLRESHLGIKLSEEHKLKISKGNLGKKMSKESIEKTRLKNKGKIRTIEQKLAISGENNYNSKLTKEKVIEIRELYKSGVKIKELCEIYKVTRGCINGVILNKNWKHI